MANFYWMAASALTWNAASTTNKWSNTSGGAFITTTGPTAGDDVFFDAASPANCVVGSGTYACRSINFTGYTRTFNHSVGTLNVGDGTAGAGGIAVKLAAGMTYTVGGILNLISTSTTQQTITCAGKTLPTTNFNGVGSNYVLADNFASTGTLTINNGTFDTSTSNYSVAVKGFFSTSGNTRVIKLNGSTVNINQGGATNGWNLNSTGLTFTQSGSTISLGTQASTSTFTGGGFTYGTLTGVYLWFGIPLGLSILDSNTFNTLNLTTNTGNNIATITFAGNSITTITNLLTLSGASGDLLQIVSDSPGTAFTIKRGVTNVAGGRTFTANYVNLTDSKADGEAKFFATNSTNTSNNVNWRFNAPNQGTQSLLGCGI